MFRRCEIDWNKTMTLKILAAEVLEVLENGRYFANGSQIEIRALQEPAVSGTRLYDPEQLDNLRKESESGATAPVPIEMVDGTTQVVARQMTKECDAVAILNFASARNPGGGFLRGAKAQEEDLCRCSGLYPCLLKCPEYYNVNRSQTSMLYTDYAIYSPNVPFFKTRGTGDYLVEPFIASVMTAPGA